jgi:hypothetical protein
MSIFVWGLLALLAGYWIWLLLIKKTPTVSYMMPFAITGMVVVIALGVMYFTTPTAVAPPMMGGRRRRW